MQVSAADGLQSSEKMEFRFQRELQQVSCQEFLLRLLSEREGFRPSRWVGAEEAVKDGAAFIRPPQACRFGGFGSPQRIAVVTPHHQTIFLLWYIHLPPRRGKANAASMPPSLCRIIPPYLQTKTQACRHQGLSQNADGGICLSQIINVRHEERRRDDPCFIQAQ